MLSNALPPARLGAAAVMIACLLLPLVLDAGSLVAAAPPDPARDGVELADAATASEADAGSLDSAPQFSSDPRPGSENSDGDDPAPRDRGESDAGSVRPRGLEAPVELRQPQRDQGGEGEPERATRDEAEENPRDPGDSPVPRPDREPREREQDRATLPSRVWPMPDGSYTFTQDFGCVQQLGNLYFPGAGCPASAPVIHTGIDLGAPEGTPFYAAASGWVTLADYDRPTPDANTRIIIQHDGRNERYATDYLHWIASYVEEGDYVRVGEPIGEVGSVGYSTGPHLHFSVTDLETGEHVDPMRWLPEESGPSDYSREQPRARLRLPAGTTFGQPESADPAPPPPPRRQDVPESPPEEERGERDRAERERDRTQDDRRADASDEAPARESKRPDRERAAAEEPATDADPDTTVDEGKTKERERLRERDKDGTDAENTDSGEDGARREKSAEDQDPDERRERDRDDNESGGGKQEQEDSRNDRGGAKRNDSGGGGGGGERNDDNGRDDKDGKDGKDGSDGADGADGQDGENGDGEDGGHGGDGGSGTDGQDGGGDDSGGNGGNGGNGGDSVGGAGGDGGDGGNGADGGRGGNGGDGGDSLNGDSGEGTRGGDGGADRES